MTQLPRDRSRDVLTHRALSVAAKNLAAAQRLQQVQEQEERHRALMPYPFTVPEYKNATQPVDLQSDEYLAYSKDIFLKGRFDDVRDIWYNIMRQSSREERIALRDSNKLCESVYAELEFRELTLKKVVFNARSSSEILVLDYRARKLPRKPTPSLSSSHAASIPRFKAVPIVRPAKWYERDKMVVNTIYFETIAFEEFKRPTYIDPLDWTSKSAFHVGVEVPSGAVLLESSLASDSLYVAPGHEHASVLVERWTHYENKDMIEEWELAEPPSLDEPASGSVSSASSESRPTSPQDSEDEGQFEVKTPLDGDGSETSVDETLVETPTLKAKVSKQQAPPPPTAATPIPPALATPTPEECRAVDYTAAPTVQNKGKKREGEKSKRKILTAPAELVTGFSVECISQIVAGRYKGVTGEQHPLLGPASPHVVYDSSWNKGIARTSRAWKSEGPLYLFLVERPSGWMPVDATDPIILNNMQDLIQTFVLDHLESLATYLNLPALPPPAKCRNPSVSPQDFLWKTFLETNPDETASLPKNLREAIIGMVMEAWRRTLLNEPVTRDSPFCTRCSSLICDKAADLKPSLSILKKEAAKLRRATTILRKYRTTAGCSCASCRKSYSRTLN